MSYNKLLGQAKLPIQMRLHEIAKPDQHQQTQVDQILMLFLFMIHYSYSLKLTDFGFQTHISQALPQVAVDSVLVAIALKVSDNANLKGLWSQKVPQHVQNTSSLKEIKEHTCAENDYSKGWCVVYFFFYLCFKVSIFLHSLR